MLASVQTARSPAEFMPLCADHAYDAVVCGDHPGEWAAVDALDVVREIDLSLPFIMVVGADVDTTACLSRGATDCVYRDDLHLLPMAVALAIRERSLLDEQRRAQEELKRSQALYRALLENPTYGICRFDSSGRFLEANETLVEMLGYATRQDLDSATLRRDIMRDARACDRLLESCSRDERIDDVLLDWTRKDGRPIKVRVGGRRVPIEFGRCGGWEVIVEDVTAQCALESQLRQLAATDPLTGLANYRQLTESIDVEIRRSSRTGRSFAVLLCDLNRLKEINDDYGHEAGNRALCRLADTFRRSCRNIDVMARCGGDEFALILPESTAADAREVQARILAHLARDSGSPPLSLSVGAAVYPRDGDSQQALFEHADAQLYAMKRRVGKRRARRAA